MQNINHLKPSSAYVGASWGSLFLGVAAYLIGLWNATMQLNERGYYFTVLLFGLFSAISLQKTVRDRAEGVSTTSLYYGVCWTGLGLSVALMVIGLWNATLVLSEKGFYLMAFALSLFSVITVQKNVRDKTFFAQVEAAVEPSRHTGVEPTQD